MMVTRTIGMIMSLSKVPSKARKVVFKFYYCGIPSSHPSHSNKLVTTGKLLPVSGRFNTRSPLSSRQPDYDHCSLIIVVHKFDINLLCREPMRVVHYYQLE
jgi:hypothetical protein